MDHIPPFTVQQEQPPQKQAKWLVPPQSSSVRLSIEPPSFQNNSKNVSGSTSQSISQSKLFVQLLNFCCVIVLSNKVVYV